jgi:predicted lipid-binding transport protein (Tim44 family)
MPTQETPLMRRPARILTLLAAVAFALAPALADARPGGGSSSGSRGSRTYSAPPATSTAPATPRQMDRTTTQRPAPPAAAPGSMRAAPTGGFFSRNPIMGGLMLGLFGAGLFGLLSGAGFFAGLGSLAGVLGFLLQIGLIVGIIMLVRSVLRRRAEPVPAGMPNGVMRTGGQPLPMGGGAAAAPVTIGQADFAQFEQMLKDVNAAWSRGDMATLSRLGTPEIAQYFRGDLADLQARGWKNETRDVRLERGDLAEAWREGARDYATVAMRFSLVDVTREISTGRVTEGDPDARTMATELWTFVRSQGGPWQLSAIQQTG